MDFFITWTTYGSWLPGDRRGWASRHRGLNEPTSAYRERSTGLTRSALGSMRHRPVVDEVIRAQCDHRGWHVHALNVRSNHVHLVVRADAPPERVMGQCKAWASRRLREAGHTPERVWTRHGSTRRLNSEASLKRAIDYVPYEQ